MVEGLVSVITPCYNGEKYLADTIESVIAQTYPNWEMFIVDDGSSDGSASLAESYAARDSRIVAMRQRNKGSAAARNKGIRHARGQYIALLDADDLWDPRFLEKQIAFLREKNAICVCCSYRMINSDSVSAERPVIAPETITLDDMKVMNRIGCLSGLYDSSKYGKVFLREELKSIRDDYAFWYDIVALEGRAYGNPEVLASYRVLGDSVTGNKMQLIGKQFRFYRSFLKESLPTAFLNTFRWGVAGIKKFT